MWYANWRTQEGRLLKYIEKGDAEGARKAISRGIRPNAINRNFRTILGQALRGTTWVTPDFIDTLASSGADTNLFDSYGDSPLQIALESGHGREMLKALLLNGARVDFRDPKGRTPLIFALERNEVDLGAVELLISAGSDVTARSDEGHSALDLAKERKLDRVVELLESSR